MKEFYLSSDFKNIRKAYSATQFPNIFYLKLKSPIEVQIELTSRCNQKCIFCYNVWKEESSSKSIKNRLSKEEHFSVIDKIIKNKIFSVIFSGGEPLLVPYLEELIRRNARPCPSNILGKVIC